MAIQNFLVDPYLQNAVSARGSAKSADNAIRTWIDHVLRGALEIRAFATLAATEKSSRPLF